MARWDRIMDLLQLTFLLKVGVTHQKVSKLQSFLSAQDFPPSPKTLKIPKAEGFGWAQAL